MQGPSTQLNTARPKRQSVKLLSPLLEEAVELSGSAALFLGVRSEVLNSAYAMRAVHHPVSEALSANAFFQASRLTTLSVLTNYSATTDYFWSRAGLKTRLTNQNYQGPFGLSAGAEITIQGGEDVRQYGAGLVAELGFDRAATSLQFRGGYSRAKLVMAARVDRRIWGQVCTIASRPLLAALWQRC